MPLYSANGSLLVDGNALRGCCCGSFPCVDVKIAIFYHYKSLGTGGNHLCTPYMEATYRRAQDMQSITELQKNHWSYLNAGSCSIWSDNDGQNFVLNGATGGSGDEWEVELHQAQVLQPGEVQLTRLHVSAPDSAREYFRELCSVYLNLLSADTKVTWAVERGYASGSCESATCSFSELKSGVFDTRTYGSADAWALQPDYSHMHVTGGWYMKNFELQESGYTRDPASTWFAFKVEKL